MATPLPGWYTDPADASRHRYWDGDVWTEKTRPGGGAIVLGASAEVGSTTKAGGSRGRTVAIVAAVAVGLAAIIGVGVALQSGDADKSPGSSNSAIERDPSNTGGWMTFTSRSGALEYLVDPEWADIYSREDEQVMYEQAATPGAEIELGGMWIQAGSLYLGGNVFVVTALDDGVGSISLKLESRLFSSELGKALDDYEEVASEAWTTGAGDEAWRVDFRGSSFGEPITASVIIISHDTTVVMAYAVASDEFDGWIGDFLAMCDSIVVVHPPINL